MQPCEPYPNGKNPSGMKPRSCTGSPSAASLNLIGSNRWGSGQCLYTHQAHIGHAHIHRTHTGHAHIHRPCARMVLLRTRCATQPWCSYDLTRQQHFKLLLHIWSFRAMAGEGGASGAGGAGGTDGVRVATNVIPFILRTAHADGPHGG